MNDWIIERGPLADPKYLMGHGMAWTWTTDEAAATRFPSEYEATAVATETGVDALRVTECES
jgi:hypothetical protein